LSLLINPVVDPQVGPMAGGVERGPSLVLVGYVHKRILLGKSGSDCTLSQLIRFR
jgi:hypothetical protein